MTTTVARQAQCRSSRDCESSQVQAQHKRARDATLDATPGLREANGDAVDDGVGKDQNPKSSGPSATSFPLSFCRVGHRQLRDTRLVD